MRTAVSLTLIGLGLAAIPFVAAQPPDDRRTGGGPGSGTANLAERMMQFDANKDDKLTKSEVTDDRLKRLFDLADADKDGTVTRNELNVLMVRERANARGDAGGFGGPGGGQRRMGGGPGGGPRGFGGPGGPPQPGQILAPSLRQRLAITPQQEKEIDALQKEVDAKLEKLLNAEQRQQLKEMRERGPGGFGPPPGRGGPGGFGPPPGGPPPGDDGTPPR
jgi:EF hand